MSAQGELRLWGERLADRGAAAAARADGGGWVDGAVETIRRLEPGDLIDAEGLRWLAGDPPSPGAMGGAFRTARRQGLIVVDGYRAATRISRHGGLVRVWRRTEVAP